MDSTAGMDVLVRRRRISFSLPGIEPQFLGRPACRVVTIPITPCRVLLQEMGTETKEDEVSGSSVFTRGRS
jgi:hypothetical protein